MTSGNRSIPTANVCPLGVLFVVASVVAPAFANVHVSATLIDGTNLKGTWMQPDRDGAVALRMPSGVRTIPIDDLASLHFEPSPASNGAAATNGGSIPVWIHTVGGGLLRAGMVELIDDHVRVHTELEPALEISLDHLRGIVLSDAPSSDPAKRRFDAVLSGRSAGHDILVTSGDEPKTLRGRVEHIGPERITFFYGNRSRTITHDKVYGIVFAALTPEDTDSPTRVFLRTGSVWAGRIRHADDEALEMDTPFGVTANWPVGRVEKVLHRSPRVVYVSDLPFRTEYEGRLHRTWPVERNRNLMGEVLSIDGRRFAKGIGCHSRTVVTVDLDGAYESFVATVGVDDHVRPRGSVVFRIASGSETLWESKVLTGRDRPVDVRVNTLDLGRLRLIVDYGDGVDLADHAVWGDARMITVRKDRS